MNIRADAAAFLSWWFHELRDMTESVLGRVAPKLVKSIEVQEGQTLDVGANPAVTRVVAVLKAQDVLLHEITLPLAVEREIDRALELHLERDLPVARERVCVDWKITNRDRAARRLHVRLLIAHRERVEHLRRTITEAGLRVIRVAVRGSDGTLIGNLLPRRIRADRMKLSPLDRRLATLACVLALSAVALTGGQWIYERVQLAGELKQASDLASRAESLARALKEGSSVPAALISVMQRPDAIDVLSTLTRVTSQDTWVYDLEVKAMDEGSYQLALGGFAPAATSLVDSLEKTPQFEQVKLISAVSAGLGTARDRVELSAKFAQP